MTTRLRPDAPFSGCVPPSASAPPSRNDILRRDLLIEIAGLEELFAPYPFLKDSLSEHLRSWRYKFQDSLRLTSANMETVRREYLGLLSEILVDSFTSTSLDEAPLLGSDGFTHSTQSLCVFIAQAKEPFNRRSPMNIEQETPLSLSPHPIATHMKRWLEERRAFCPSNPLYEGNYVALRREYSKLLDTGSPALPIVDLETLLKSSKATYVDSLRRKLPAEFADIKNQFTTHPDFKDNFTNKVKEWLGEFKKAFRVSRDAEKVLEDFKHRMQLLCIDARTSGPLDSRAYLGSDGLLHSEQSLGVFRAQTPEPEKSRSPVNKEDLRPFIVRAHTIARYMVLWLEKHEARLHDETMRAAFQASGGSIEGLAVIRGDPSVMADKLYAQQTQEKHQKARAEGARAKGGDASDARERAAKAREEFARRAQQARKSAEAETKGMHQKADEADAKAKEAYENLKSKAEKTKASVDGLDADIDGLNAKMGATDSAMSDAERDNATLQQSMDDLKTEIERAKKEQGDRVSSTLLAIGTCVIATIAINQVVPGSGAAATPISGGFKGSIVIPI